jgi:predicted transcriptional regulator
MRNGILPKGTLRTLRIALGITQRDLACEWGVAPSTIRRLEGKSLDRIHRDAAIGLICRLGRMELRPMLDVT